MEQNIESIIQLIFHDTNIYMVAFISIMLLLFTISSQLTKDIYDFHIAIERYNVLKFDISRIKGKRLFNVLFMLPLINILLLSIYSLIIAYLSFDLKSIELSEQKKSYFSNQRNLLLSSVCSLVSILAFLFYQADLMFVFAIVISFLIAWRTIVQLTDLIFNEKDLVSLV
jgi:hypothetical protein